MGAKGIAGRRKNGKWANSFLFYCSVCGFAFTALMSLPQLRGFLNDFASQRSAGVR